VPDNKADAVPCERLPIESLVSESLRATAGLAA
jgi:hypothetical protein